MHKAIIGSVVAAGSLALLMAISSFKIVDDREVAVGATFGSVSDTYLKGGFHVVNPLTSYTEYPVRATTYIMRDIGVPAQDNLKTTMDVSITGNFIEGLVPTVRKESGSPRTFMSTHFNSRVRALIIEVGKELAVESQAFYGGNTLQEMEDVLLTRVNDELNPLGYTVSAIKFTDIRLPEVVTKAVIRTKERTEMVKQQEAQLAIAEQKAQEAVKRAEANRDSSIANAEAKKHEADAEAYKILTEANAQAQANAAMSKSITPSLNKYMQIQQWNGVLPQYMLSDSQMLMVK